jgi:hypothetical protein
MPSFAIPNFVQAQRNSKFDKLTRKSIDGTVLKGDRNLNYC